LMNN